ncbi:hypothetical protein BH24ACT4_BH24ACT4_12580 [soil metagenome]
MFAGLIRDLLLPRTDAGVLAQVVGLVVVGVIAAVLVRRSREGLLFVSGVVLLTAGFFGLRMLH